MNRECVIEQIRIMRVCRLCYRRPSSCFVLKDTQNVHIVGDRDCNVSYSCTTMVSFSLSPYTWILKRDVSLLMVREVETDTT